MKAATNRKKSIRKIILQVDFLFLRCFFHFAAVHIFFFLLLLLLSFFVWWSGVVNYFEPKQLWRVPSLDKILVQQQNWEVLKIAMRIKFIYLPVNILRSVCPCFSIIKFTRIASKLIYSLLKIEFVDFYSSFYRNKVFLMRYLNSN